MRREKTETGRFGGFDVFVLQGVLRVKVVSAGLGEFGIRERWRRRFRAEWAVERVSMVSKMSEDGSRLDIRLAFVVLIPYFLSLELLRC